MQDGTDNNFTWEISLGEERKMAKKYLLVLIVVIISFWSILNRPFRQSGKSIPEALMSTMTQDIWTQLEAIFYALILSVLIFSVVWSTFVIFKRIISGGREKYSLSDWGIRITDQSGSTKSYQWHEFSGYFVSPSMVGVSFSLVRKGTRFYVYSFHNIQVRAGVDNYERVQGYLNKYLTEIKQDQLKKQERIFIASILIPTIVIGLLITWNIKNKFDQEREKYNETAKKYGNSCYYVNKCNEILKFSCVALGVSRLNYEYYVNEKNMQIVEYCGAFCDKRSPLRYCRECPPNQWNCKT